MLFRLAAGNQNYAKAVEYGKQAAEAGVTNTDDLVVMAQLYYLQKDCKDSNVWGDKAIASARKAGEAPKENLYLFKLKCADDANDTPGKLAALYDLVRLTRKTEYWNNLIRLERQDERDDHNTLMIYRVMYDTKSMNVDTDYIEMAQLLGDAGLPGEAQSVLETLMASTLMKDEHKERTTRLLNSLKARAETDKKALGAIGRRGGQEPGRRFQCQDGRSAFRVRATMRVPSPPSTPAFKKARSSTSTKRMFTWAGRRWRSRASRTPRRPLRSSRARPASVRES